MVGSGVSRSSGRTTVFMSSHRSRSSVCRGSAGPTCGWRPGEAAGVGAGVGDLEEIIVTALGQAEDFLDLRLGLQDEVLRAASAEDQDARRAALLRLEHDRGRLVHVAQGVDLELAPAEAHG